MKKIAFSICLVLSGFAAFAQNTTLSKADSANKVAKPVLSTLKKAEGASMSPKTDIVTNIYNSPELNMLYKVIKSVGLIDTFRSRGPITVFAPTNQAFATMSPGKLDTLLRFDHKYNMIALLTYHALAGKVTSKDIQHEISSNKGMATFTTLTGSKLTAKLDNNRNIILIDENGGQSIISKFDLEQNNGMIHIVTAVLVPKPKDI